MKAIIWLLVLVGAGWAAMYFVGGYSSFDPNEQGEKAKAAIKEGMTLAETIDLMGEPRKYRIIKKTVQRIGGQDVQHFERGAENKFDRARVEQRISEGSLEWGFTITMAYSNRTAFTVTYDSEGKVEGIEDAVTMADLLDARD